TQERRQQTYRKTNAMNSHVLFIRRWNHVITDWRQSVHEVTPLEAEQLA
ncbi:hypothetical protein TNCV_3416821, partial [Trichonephila clavipes]